MFKFLIAVVMLVFLSCRKKDIKPAELNDTRDIDEVINLLEATNTNSPIVEESDPTMVTHELRIGELTFGFCNKGGGYLNYLDLGDGANQVYPDYGKGWQGSLRDRLHGFRYNPTQAGFRDHAGAPVEVELSENKFYIPAFNLPLYGDPQFDFTQYEDLASDYVGYNDNNNSDKDGLAEIGMTQDDELRSEFDFTAMYENSTGLAGGTIPVLRYFCRYIYMREPKAILQFGENAVKETGADVLVGQFHKDDISRIIPGAQSSTNIDLAEIIFTGYGIRLFTDNGYTTALWYQDNQWQNASITEFEGRGNEMKFELKPSTRGNETLLQNSFLVLSQGTNPDTDKAFAVYTPMVGKHNVMPVVGTEKASGKVVYRENRSTRSFIFFSNVIPSQIGIRNRFIMDGLLAPGNGQEGVVEAIEHETFILYGTPNEILQAVQTINQNLISG